MNELNFRNINLNGGKFLAEGEYTCVYADPPVGCVPGTLQTSVDYNPNDTTLVSRLAISSGKEFSNQTDVRNAMIRLDQKYPGLRFKDHFNIAVATCTPRMVNEDLQPDTCSVRSLKNIVDTPGDKPNVINFLTRRQGPDLTNSNEVFKGMPLNEKRIKFRKAYFDLMNATVALNSEEIIHYDMHSGNIGWTVDPWPNKTLVIFDWGQSISGYDNFLKVLLKDIRDLEDLKMYDQYILQVQTLEKIAFTKDNIIKLIKQEQVEPKGYYFSSLEKLFFAWDTYSLIIKVYSEKLPGLEDFLSEKLGDKDAFLSGKFMLELLDNFILKVNISRNKDLFIQEIWNIIAAAFNETPVYKLGSNFVTNFTGASLPVRKYNIQNKSRSKKYQSKKNKTRKVYSVSITPTKSKMKRSRVCANGKVLDKKNKRCRNPKKPGPKKNY
jgi:hypothetical protein